MSCIAAGLAQCVEWAGKKEGRKDRGEAGRVRLNLIALQFTSRTDAAVGLRWPHSSTARTHASTCIAHMFINVFHRFSHAYTHGHGRGR